MTPEDIAAVNELLPNYIGFVFSEKSRRYVSPSRARRLRDLLDPSVRAAGVFVNEEPEHIARLLREGIIDTVQLHGKESPDYIRKLRSLTDCPVIRAFRAEQAVLTDVLQEGPDVSLADFILLDSGSGGTGETFDWEMIRHVKRPYFLAGGLTPDNVGKAVSMLHPYGVDVSSGIETSGSKDRKKMIKFVHAVRAACGKDIEQ